MGRPAPLATTPPRAVLYLRQSTYREESVSLDLQEAAARDHARRNGYTVVAVEADPGVSGRTFNRPAVKRVMGMIEAGTADVVVLWKWSRLSRARLDWAVALDQVETLGGRIESATEPTDTTTSAGRLARGILAEFNAFESERIGEEWQRAIRSRQQRGLPGTGGTRFGYQRTAKDIYEPDTVTGPVLAELYRRAAAGTTTYALAQWLTQQNVPPPRSAPWSRETVRRILDSGFGAGLIHVNVRSSDSHHLPGRHKPVIDTATWQAYTRVRRHAALNDVGNAAKYPLTGLIYCGDCGSRMSGITRRAHKGERQRAYGCNRYQKYRVGKYVTTVKSRVEEWVRVQVNDIAAELERAAEISEEAQSARVSSVNDATAIARELEQVDAQLQRLAVDWARPASERILGDDDAYRAASAQLRQKKQNLLAREAVIENAERQGGERVVAANLGAAWERLTEDERRSMLRALVGAVIVEPPRPGRRAASYRIIWRWELPRS